MPVRHLVLDVEAVLDPSVPVKEGRRPDDTFEPPIRWQIVSLGCFSFVDFVPEMIGCIRGEDERAKVAAYAAHVEKDRPVVVTWNGRFFDNPVIGFRALRYGLAMPWWYGTAKGPRYRYGEKAIDVKDWLADFGATATASQHQTSRLIGWPGKGETSGEDVAQLIAEGKFEAVNRYCLEDVAHLAAIWLRCELLRGNLRPSDWRRTARGLLTYLAKQSATASIVEQVDREIFIEGMSTGQLRLTE